jgi:hypothetical protein
MYDHVMESKERTINNHRQALAAAAAAESGKATR